MAIDLGCRGFDTAPAYGNGLAEVELGLVLSSSPYQCEITTKFGIPAFSYGAKWPTLAFGFTATRKLLDPNYGNEYRRRIFSVDEMVTTVERSLRRLKRDCIENFMIHEPLGILTQPVVDDLCATAERLRTDGKICRWGAAGPASSIKQFKDCESMDVFQFPIGQGVHSSRRPMARYIGYGLYAHFRELRSSGMTTDFLTYAKELIDKEGHDVIIATTDARTLSKLAPLFQ